MIDDIGGRGGRDFTGNEEKSAIIEILVIISGDYSNNNRTLFYALRKNPPLSDNVLKVFLTNLNLDKLNGDDFVKIGSEGESYRLNRKPLSEILNSDVCCSGIDDERKTSILRILSEIEGSPARAAEAVAAESGATESEDASHKREPCIIS